MPTIRVVTGAARGPTRKSSYDAALARAGLENYNLIPVSSVIPRDATVEPVDEVSGVGSAGQGLHVVEARATITGPGQASACIGWGRQPDDGAGLFYEAAGESLEAAERRVEDGLEHGRSLRGWEFGQHLLEGITIEGRDGEHATAVAVATYGEAHDIIR